MDVKVRTQWAKQGKIPARKCQHAPTLGRHVCITCGETLRNNMEANEHDIRKGHTVLWLCLECDNIQEP